MRIFECGYCKFKGPEPMFKWGKGREYGEHPEHRYCPRCHVSIDWYGYSIVKVVSDTWEEFLYKAKRRLNYAGSSK